MLRRDFLKYSAATVALVASGGAVRVAGAQDPPLGEVLDEFDYRGRHARVLRDRTGQLELELNGRRKSPGIVMRADSGFTSTVLPFRTRPSARTLVRDLIDNDGLLFVL